MNNTRDSLVQTVSRFKSMLRQNDTRTLKVKSLTLRLMARLNTVCLFQII